VRIERKIGASVAILGSLLFAVSGAVPALASSGPSAGPARLSALRFARAANATSTGFAGWAFGPKAATSVTAEFKVPALKCTSATTGVSPAALMFTGSSSSPNVNLATVLLACSGGSPLAIPAVVVDGAETNGTKTVHTGDVMTATVVTSTTKTTVTLADVTKGHTFKLTMSGKGAAALQEQIGDGQVASNGKALPIVNFGTISYSNGAVSGKAIGSVKPQTAVNMQTAKKVLQILTGKITGAKKNAFTTTFKHA
jgi:hypothetical protein